MLDREERRLKKLFGKLLRLSAAGSAICLTTYACGKGSSSSDVDASTTDEAGMGDDGVAPGADAGADVIDDNPCAPQFVQVDAGPPPDGAVECSNYQLYKCGLPPNVSLRQSCFFELNDCASLCPVIAFSCKSFGDWCFDGGIVQDTDASFIVECVACANGVGRRPRGLVSARPVRNARNARGPRGAGKSRPEDASGAIGASGASGAIGAFFATAAHLEAASIHAFAFMEHELADVCAPAELITAARRARADEVRHARVMSRIARSHGEKPARVRVRRGGTRTLAEIARENAAEGCVRETFGALVATWQSLHAEDTAIAGAMQKIAADETRHAALAWATARWARTRLSRSARKDVDRAMRAELDKLAREARMPQNAELARLAGLPPSFVQAQMIEQIKSQLAPRAVRQAA